MYAHCFFSKSRFVSFWFSLWIYTATQGGAYNAGAATGYDGGDLAVLGDVIVVSLNYRVGLMGFLALQSLIQESSANVNLGLKDQQFAFQWVQNNIANFGGILCNAPLYASLWASPPTSNPPNPQLFPFHRRSQSSHTVWGICRRIKRIDALPGAFKLATVHTGYR